MLAADTVTLLEPFRSLCVTFSLSLSLSLSLSHTHTHTHTHTHSLSLSHTHTLSLSLSHTHTHTHTHTLSLSLSHTHTHTHTHIYTHTHSLTHTHTQNNNVRHYRRPTGKNNAITVCLKLSLVPCKRGFSWQNVHKISERVRSRPRQNHWRQMHTTNGMEGPCTRESSTVIRRPRGTCLSWTDRCFAHFTATLACFFHTFVFEEYSSGKKIKSVINATDYQCFKPHPLHKNGRSQNTVFEPPTKTTRLKNPVTASQARSFPAASTLLQQHLLHFDYLSGQECWHQWQQGRRREKICVEQSRPAI